MRKLSGCVYPMAPGKAKGRALVRHRAAMCRKSMRLRLSFSRACADRARGMILAPRASRPSARSREQRQLRRQFCAARRPGGQTEIPSPSGRIVHPHGQPPLHPRPRGAVIRQHAHYEGLPRLPASCASVPSGMWLASLIRRVGSPAMNAKWRHPSS